MIWQGTFGSFLTRKSSRAVVSFESFAPWAQCFLYSGLFTGVDLAEGTTDAIQVGAAGSDRFCTEVRLGVATGLATGWCFEGPPNVDVYLSFVTPMSNQLHYIYVQHTNFKVFVKAPFNFTPRRPSRAAISFATSNPLKESTEDDEPFRS